MGKRLEARRARISRAVAAVTLGPSLRGFGMVCVC
jgi:hypothetical protein